MTEDSFKKTELAVIKYPQKAQNIQVMFQFLERNLFGVSKTNKISGSP